MPRFAANLSMLYPQHAFIDRFAAAAADGFAAVEYLFPYEHPASDLAAQFTTHCLQQVLFNAPPGDFAQDERRSDEGRGSAIPLDLYPWYGYYVYMYRLEAAA